MDATERARVAAQMTAGMQKNVPHNRALGLEVVDFGPRDVWMRLPFAPQLVGDPSRALLHGGAISSLMDAASGLAVMVALGRPSKIATLDLRIDYMKPAASGRDVIAHTTCYRVTQHVCFVRGMAYVEREDDPVASVAATFARKS